MAFSRPLGGDRSHYAKSSAQIFCCFCGKGVFEGSFFDLRKHSNYTETISRLKYMNIKAANKLKLNICKPCYVSFNSAYNFCKIYNRTQLKLANSDVIDAIEAKKAKKAKKNQTEPIKAVLDNIKTEPESSDEIDVGIDDLASSFNKIKNPIVDASKSWRSYTWTCCHCDAEYKKLSTLRSHSKKMHGVCFGFECPDCDIKLNDYLTFVAHLRNHKENLRYYCDVCDKPIVEQRYHNHVGDKAMCWFCGEIFPDDSSRLLHQKTYEMRHIADYQNGKKLKYVITVPDLQFGTAYPDCDVFQSWKDYVWVCRFCEIKFHSTQAIRNHAELVHGKCFAMKCLDCNATAVSFHMLILHIMRHRPSLRHFCPFCDKLAHSEESFRAHVREHLTNSSYCVECGQNYPNRITQLSKGDSTSVYWFLEPAGSNASDEQVVESTEPMDYDTETNEEGETNEGGQTIEEREANEGGETNDGGETIEERESNEEKESNEEREEDATSNDEENMEQEGQQEEKRGDEDDSSDEGMDNDDARDEGIDNDDTGDEGTDNDDARDEGMDTGDEEMDNEDARDEGMDNDDIGDEGADNDDTSDEGTDKDDTGDEGADNDDTGDEAADNADTGDEAADNADTGDEAMDNDDTADGGMDNDFTSVKENSETVDYNLPSPITCAYCNETFTDKRLYRQHTNTTYCPICDKAYNCFFHKKDHMFHRHMAAKPYECYKCGKLYHKRHRAYTCMESHLASETKLCNICHSKVLESFLEEHVETHKYDYDSYEQACGYGFCTMKFKSWAERVNHRHSKHSAFTYRKIIHYRSYRTQRDILGLLPMEEISNEST